MSKCLKIILIVGLCLTLLGGCLFFAGMMLSSWDLDAFSNTTIEEKTYTEPSEAPVTRVSLNFENADIRIRFDENAERLSIVYPQTYDRKGEPKTEITLTETEGGVAITERSIWHKQWISLWDFTDPQVTVILPVRRTYELTVETDNGEIDTETVIQKDENGAVIRDETLCRVSSITLKSDNGRIGFLDTDYLYCEGAFTCETANGKIQLGQLNAQSLLASTNNGAISLQSATAAELISLETDNGEIRVNGNLTAHEIRLKSDNGKLIATSAGEWVASKVTAETDNGDIALRGAVRADSVTLKTDNGDISATLGGAQNDYGITAEYDLGNCNVPSHTNGEKPLFLKTDTGDIEIIFAGDGN